ncbi:transglutaminase family protein [Ideonella sp. A 288]|uniref:transglutaminase family protein n=1 Tax=Ideonella sp. A 288 TaxID=1962181 RepID=UPI000B4AF85A|nr:transglutaminase family protein [Ideonella sp. A 288]
MTDHAVRLSVCHETVYDYDAPVEVAHHSAWLRPRDTAWQTVSDWQLQIDPEPECPVQESLDAFGNWRHGFSHSRVHDRLQVTSTFEVTLTPPPPLDDDAIARSPPWDEVAHELRYRAGQQQPEAAAFVLGTPFAPRDPKLAAFGQGLFAPERSLAAVAIGLMQRVHARMKYVPNSTDVATDALQALAQGRGVCQDFAHLMIGTLRSHGLAARYVSGYLLTQPPPGQPRLVGADASHAWVAVWCPVLNWIALDPTNDIAVVQDHVTLSWGRDYADVAPLRGVIRGGGQAPPDVAVTVAPIE